MVAPTPVPALPDLDRETVYNPTASAGPFDVGFAIYGDGTDYQNWIDVYAGNNKLTVTDFTVTSASGPLGLLLRPITDARVTLATAFTGQLRIVGSRRPRRTSQLTEGHGVSARDFNQIISDIVAMLREAWKRIIGAENLANAAISLITSTGPLSAPIYATRTAAAAATISPAVTYVQVQGFSTVGDGGYALYKREAVIPSTPAYFQSVDGAYWRLVTEPATPQMVGAKGDGATNDTAAMIVWGACGLKGKRLPSGTYVINSTIDLEDGTNLICDPGSLIDGSAAGAGFGGSPCVRVAGTVTQIADLAADTGRGGGGFNLVSAGGLTENDIGLIYDPTNSSFSTFDPNYRAGEFFHVRGIAGVGISITSPLYAPYVAAVVDVYRVNTKTVRLTGLRVKAPNSTGLTGEVPPIQLTFNAFSALVDCRGYGSDYCGIRIDKSYGVQVVASRGLNIAAITTGLQYGIVISNCQNCRVLGGTWHGSRHGVTMGGDGEIGAVPCRNIKLIGATVSSPINVPGADMHANCEECYYEECTIYGGVNAGGLNCGLINCEIIEANAQGVSIVGSQIVGGTFTIRGCKIRSVYDPQAFGYSVIDFGGSGGALTTSTTQAFTLEIIDCEINTPNVGNAGPNSVLISVINRGCLLDLNLRIMGLMVTAPLIDNIVLISNTAGANTSRFIQIEGVVGIPAGATLLNAGTGYITSPMRLQSICGKASIIVDNTGNTFTTAAAINLPWAFPKTPRVQVTRTGNDTNLLAYIGNRIGVAYAQITSATVRPYISTDDATNFSSTVTVNLHYEVSIRDF